jgi:hypothetical protein
MAVEKTGIRINIERIVRWGVMLPALDSFLRPEQTASTSVHWCPLSPRFRIYSRLFERHAKVRIDQSPQIT